jgi:hypothetical protein
MPGSRLGFWLLLATFLSFQIALAMIMAYAD